MVLAQDATDEEGEGGVSAAAGGGRSEAEEVAAGAMSHPVLKRTKQG
jgi:hypothetical protein